MNSEVTVPALWLLLTHFVVGVSGYCMAYFITCRTGELMAAKKGKVMPTNPKISAFTILIVGMLIVMGIGVQQFFYQSSEDSHDQCMQNWAGRVLDSLDKRSDGRQVLDDARAVRDAADSKVNDTILRFLVDPQASKDDPVGARRELIAVYREARSADVVYKQAQADYETAVTENPYPAAPELACD